MRLSVTARRRDTSEGDDLFFDSEGNELEIGPQATVHETRRIDVRVGDS